MKNQGLPENRPSARWAQFDELFHDYLPDDQAAISANDILDGLQQSVDALGAATEEKDKQRLSRVVQDGMVGYGSEIARRGYNLGYGDGWTAGTVTTIRLVLGSQGATVPSVSDALAHALGLPSPDGGRQKVSKRTFPVDQQACIDSFISVQPAEKREAMKEVIQLLIEAYEQGFFAEAVSYFRSRFQVWDGVDPIG